MIPRATLTILIAIFALELAWLADGYASFGRLSNRWVRVPASALAIADT
jgi:hypothetical protein